MNTLNYNPPNYPLEWFDEVFFEILHPSKLDPVVLNSENAGTFMNRFDREVRSLRLRIKTHVIQLSSPKKVKTVVLQYHTAIRLLKQQANVNYQNYSQKNKALKKIGQALMSMMDELTVFLELHYAPFLSLPPLNPPIAKSAPIDAKFPQFNIVCSLSADQIGLILKAADDLKIIISRSLSLVFKTIIPFLSTKNAKRLSWASVRSHTYVIEESDKEVLINLFGALIEKIRSY
ncbi:MAG: hypothetical protein JWM28_2005 [Chitinophagaceae bacterium]|nr:hypothetical protein [Chitinophagaceae bacterium]